jgi:acyl-CoA-binding protein
MIETILHHDPRPLAQRREPGARFLGNCRHFSTFTVALLRRAGIPSRARCGFGNYFERGKWIDHWIVEHWNGDRWVELDAQIDELQRNALGLAADPSDFPPGEFFLSAGVAWQRCQAGREDGDRFGILDMWGKWFIKGNIARDLASLNKVEMLPWDGWGDLATKTPAQGGEEYVDEIAALTTSGDLDAIRDRYESDSGLRVPSTVVCFDAPTPYEDEVPELA